MMKEDLAAPPSPFMSRCDVLSGSSLIPLKHPLSFDIHYSLFGNTFADCRGRDIRDRVLAGPKTADERRSTQTRQKTEQRQRPRSSAPRALFRDPLFFTLFSLYMFAFICVDPRFLRFARHSVNSYPSFLTATVHR